ncbi:hypothetical protein TCDM_10358 [Trypanosoma cruzi Dm28c]|uniref:Uncharacterized protein n=1 Tax=Trypanosoma cruzi Dm28c TaxID=1416333 RepID=V5AMT6_TRYCR|nr:hypothetical protein TCDM_10358 [Trypanosoma cruzi Dm28c]
MCNFVCGNANAPRRVSHVPWIKVHGANVVAKIRRCVARGHHKTHTERAPTTPATAASGPSSIMTRQKNSLPSRLQCDAEPNSTQSHAVHHTRRKGDSGCAHLPSPFSSRSQRKTTAATRNCQHALQKKHSNPLQCASCVCVCLQKHKAN